MNKRLKKISLVFVALIMCITGNVFAMTPVCGYKFTRGVSNCCYYVDGNAGGYSMQISYAVDNWVDTGWGWNPIYMTPVSSNYATHMDFYGRTASTDSYLNTGVAAYTSTWNTDGTLVANKGDLPTHDYFYTEIVFNQSVPDSYDNRVAKHEMGHAFGLKHYAERNSIMYPNLEYMEAYYVQQCDQDAINYLYT